MVSNLSTRLLSTPNERLDFGREIGVGQMALPAPPREDGSSEIGENTCDVWKTWIPAG